MSSISVKWQGADPVISMYVSQRRELSNVIASVRSVRSYRCMRGRNFSAVYRALDKVVTRLEDEKNDVQHLENALTEILNTYKSCEDKVAGQIEAKELEEKTSPFKWAWKNTWSTVSKAGIIGAGISAVGSLITGGWSASTGLSAGKNVLSAIGGVSSTVAKGVDANWKEALFGLNDGLSGLDTSSVGKTFTSSWAKQFGKDLSFGQAATVGDKIKVATKWGGHMLTLASNFIDNVKEFEGKEDQTGRMVAETVIETGIDIAVGAASTATVSAIATALGVTAAPALVIGAGAVAVSWAANGVCKWITRSFGEEKDIAEFASDLVCDTAEKIGRAVGDATRVVKNTFVRWGKALFG